MVDDLAQRLDRPVAETLALLTALELRGVVIQEPGKIFRPALSPNGMDGSTRS